MCYWERPGLRLTGTLWCEGSHDGVGGGGQPDLAVFEILSSDTKRLLSASPGNVTLETPLVT